MELILMLMFIIPVAFILYAKFKAANGDLKTDAIEFDTQKTVQQITGVLRSVKCQMQKLEDDPLAGSDGSPQPVLALLMTGKVGFFEMFKHLSGSAHSEWGVQIIVYDLGNKRHIDMVALGESAIGASWRGYVTGNHQHLDIRFSKDKRDQIAQMLA